VRGGSWAPKERSATLGVITDSNIYYACRGISIDRPLSRRQHIAVEKKEPKPKGVEGLIEIENPNLIKPKMKVRII
jgi:hypothetical protein